MDVVWKAWLKTLKVRSLLCISAVSVLLGAPAVSWATNGYQLIGIVQRSMGMGGAVVAAPCDPMTAISNPPRLHGWALLSKLRCRGVPIP
jgi:hypothetical protein